MWLPCHLRAMLISPEDFRLSVVNTLKRNNSKITVVYKIYEKYFFSVFQMQRGAAHGSQAKVPYSIEELDSISVPLVCYLKSFHAPSWL